MTLISVLPGGFDRLTIFHIKPKLFSSQFPSNSVDPQCGSKLLCNRGTREGCSSVHHGSFNIEILISCALQVHRLLGGPPKCSAACRLSVAISPIDKKVSQPESTLTLPSMQLLSLSTMLILSVKSNNQGPPYDF